MSARGAPATPASDGAVAGASRTLADVAAEGDRWMRARLGELDPRDRPVTRQLDHVAPAAATRVEDPRACGQAQVLDHAIEHFAPSAVPPVAVLRLVRLQLVVAVHPRCILS